MGRKNLAQERLGMIGKNKFGSTMEILEYKGSNNVLIRFEKGKPIYTTWDIFNQGNIKSPFDKTVCNIGFIGEGEYKVSMNRKATSQYNTWRGMLMRCYDEKFQEIRPTYKECTVCDEWHNFQTFAQWYDENYYYIDGEQMHLDKDILIKGNKIYSPNTCVFVPKNINMLFTKRNSQRGDLPIGVSLEKSTGKFKVHCNNGIEQERKGCFITQEEAFLVYKNAKEKHIKEVAEKYRDKIPNELYNSMMNYMVEITD